MAKFSPPFNRVTCWNLCELATAEPTPPNVSMEQPLCPEEEDGRSRRTRWVGDTVVLASNRGSRTRLRG
ncbi:hypothetical protein LZ31DRAFT_550022 [Colletotrichum somersetense]|nr:hypothetical protein LZ31DRAFT_550022 [Colletotrichum somersetense]